MIVVNREGIAFRHIHWEYHIVESVHGDTQLYAITVHEVVGWNIQIVLGLVVDATGKEVLAHITIDNCALPGEMIRLKKDQVKIAADQAFAANGYFWHIGKLKRDKDGKATTEFAEEESWLTKGSKNTYKQGDDNSRKAPGKAQLSMVI